MSLVCVKITMTRNHNEEKTFNVRQNRKSSNIRLFSNKTETCTTDIFKTTTL